MRNVYPLMLLAAAVPAMATEAPPPVPDGPVEYESVVYEDSVAETTPAYDVPAGTVTLPDAPEAPPASSERKGYITLNAFTTNYQVRGMGFCNNVTEHGFSSLRGSFIFPNRDMFNRGIYQRVSGEFGVIWDARCPIGDTPLAHARYAMGKEIFPNLTVELGTTFRRGGIEGYLARMHDNVHHRATWEFDVTATYNDYQKGFFGSVSWGLGVWGLTGSYFDAELGYRFTDVYSRGDYGLDLEVSAGIAPSVKYWGSRVEGVDAYRVKVAFCPHSLSGKFGRDAHWQIKPWVQAAWAGSTSAKLDRYTGYGPVDHFQITVGLEGGWNF